MKLLRLILCLCTGVTLLHGGDRGDGHNWPQRFRMPPPRAWLGLEVSKPDETITAHLPDLPQGIGFVIRSIEKGGPAETAGLRDLDVICKFNDQLLVNESQLAALLRLANPGEEVKLTGFRAGKPLAATLKLGESPTRAGVPSELLDQTLLPGECRGPMRVVNLAGKVATYSNEDGRLEVRKLDDGYEVLIRDPKNEPLYEGRLPADGSVKDVPDAWRRRVYALRRGLDHQLENHASGPVSPRPRVVQPPPPAPNP